MSSVALLPARSQSQNYGSNQSLEKIQEELAALKREANTNKVCVKIFDVLCLLPCCALHIATCGCGRTDCAACQESYYQNPQGFRLHPSDCTACECRGCWDPKLPPKDCCELWCMRDICVLCYCCAKEGPEHYLTGEKQQKFLRLQQLVRERGLVANLFPPPPQQQMSASEQPQQHSSPPPSPSSRRLALPPPLMGIVSSYMDDDFERSVAPDQNNLEYVPAPKKDWTPGPGLLR